MSLTKLCAAAATVLLAQAVNASQPRSTTLLSQHELDHTPEIRRQLQWHVQAAFEGQTFFDNFDFFSADDPNHGAIKYVDAPTAFSSGLAFWTKDGVPGIQVEHWATLPVGTPRNSVRITSKNMFEGGLFIFDLALLPWGCGVWPAVWMLGATGGGWPFEGEIDIIEGVHSRKTNQMTIHTAPGCTLGSDTSGYSGSKMSDNCDSSNGGNGCSIMSNSNVSYGEGFNLAGGGVMALLWDVDGLKMWNWERATVPQDVTHRTPTPAHWGQPVAAFHRSSCDPATFFKAQVIILNVNLCGDWAGNTYGATGYCPGTCATQIADPANLVNTVMLINSIVVYQQGQYAHPTAVPASSFDGLGAAGPINPLSRSGAEVARARTGIWAMALVLAAALM